LVLDLLYNALSRDESLGSRELADCLTTGPVHSWWPKLTWSRLEVEHILRAEPSRFRRDMRGRWRLVHSEHSATPSARVRMPRRDDAPVLMLHAWQKEALQRWREGGRRGIVEAVTGAGKTHLGIAAIEDAMRSPSDRTVVLVPTIELMYQWEHRLRAIYSVPIGRVGGGCHDGLAANPITIYVARSAAESLASEVSRIAEESRVLLIADECHRYGAPTFSQALRAPYAATLGLSATPERSNDAGMEHHVLPGLGPVIYRLDHPQAVAARVVADFRVVFLGVRFEPIEEERHAALTEEIAKAWSMLIKEHPFLAGVAHFFEAAKILASREDPTARYWLKLVSERRRLLYGAEQRHELVRSLGQAGFFRERRCLLFHESIHDCEHLALLLREAGVRATAHHSGLSSEVRSKALSDLCRGMVQALVAPRTLDEGIDVPEVSAAIIVAGTRVKRQMIQRMGRALRYVQGKQRALIIRIFVRGAGDDPMQPGGDPFGREMLAEGRAVTLHWPEDRGSVAATWEVR
jgi:superfamily II DNA or RNA helicase